MANSDASVTPPRETILPEEPASQQAREQISEPALQAAPSKAPSKGKGKAQAKSGKASQKTDRAKRASSSAYERRKEKALDRIHTKAASKAAPLPASPLPHQSQAQLSMMMSPAQLQGSGSGHLNPLFPIDVTGIWGPAQQGPGPGQGEFLPPSVQRLEALPSTSTALPVPQLPLGMPSIQDIIAAAFTQGISAGLQQRGSVPQVATASVPIPGSPPVPVPLAAEEPDEDDLDSSSESEDGEIRETGLSDDEKGGADYPKRSLPQASSPRSFSLLSYTRPCQHPR